MVKRARQGGGALPSNQDVEATLKNEKHKALKHAERLVQKNPELRTSLVQMYKTKQMYLRAEELSND